MKIGRFGSSEYDTDRYGIGFEDGTEHTLHCGDCFEIQQVDGSWISVRIEKGEHGWYLVDTKENHHDIPWKAVNAKI